MNLIYCTIIYKWLYTTFDNWRAKSMF